MTSRGPTTGQNCYVTFVFSAVPEEGDKITSGCITPAFLWAHDWT